ncbi:TIGR04222 domain-containing membrane protein [Kitasatospora sp. GP82]|uniref:TIGR04222 domain-containing membrane protein n=1 Tax=Kitasatospora sp. GP82 TaxID=3035089 RepID=UPI002473A326|nr:TIGR04222 domain-containing membrane protein [Kitasatospora sp. GP82]MDH6125898.1 uncharacterized protein (TIGR04222 family) [Kitasatospora sp. GP82]
MWYTELGIATALVLGAGLWTSVSRQRMHRVPSLQGLPGHGLPLPDTAFLAGGPARAAEVVIVRMQQEGRLIVSRDGTATVTDPQPRDPAEAVLIEAAGPGGQCELALLRTAVMRSPEIQRIGDHLAERGLMRRPELYRSAVRARRLLQLALLAALALGVVASISWMSRPWWEQDTSTPPFFPFLALLLVGAAWSRSARPGRSRVTPAGVRQLSLMKQGSSAWLPYVGVGAATALVLGEVALEGVEALEDEDLREALSDRTRSAVGGSSDGYGSGFGSDAGAAAVAWCSSSSPDGGSGGSHGGSHGGSSCGSSSGCGSSGHSCGGSGHSCSSSSCSSGSSCGSGCGGS